MKVHIHALIKMNLTSVEIRLNIFHICQAKFPAKLLIVENVVVSQNVKSLGWPSMQKGGEALQWTFSVQGTR